MTKDKYYILDFFFDGDVVITEPREYININDVLAKGNYMFATIENKDSLERFWVHTFSRKEVGFCYITLRIPNGKKNIQEEIKELVELQKMIGSNNCTWSVVEDIYCQTKVRTGFLVDTAT